eukprot:m.63419 g.63419  ORF g.63419 m.63419 type:complete len:1960 (+) comp15835_c0_seq3:250-6129(+)
MASSPPENSDPPGDTQQRLRHDHQSFSGFLESQGVAGRPNNAVASIDESTVPELRPLSAEGRAKSPTQREPQSLYTVEQQPITTTETQFNFMGPSPVLSPSAKSSTTSRSSKSYNMDAHDGNPQHSPHHQLVKDNLNAKDNSLMRKKREQSMDLHKERRRQTDAGDFNLDEQFVVFFPYPCGSTHPFPKESRRTRNHEGMIAAHNAFRFLCAIKEKSEHTEVLFKSIRVFGGGSQSRTYLDTVLGKDRRTYKFQAAVERARSSLAELRRLGCKFTNPVQKSLFLSDKVTTAPEAVYGTIDFDGNTNQAPYVAVDIQEFGSTDTYVDLTRTLVSHFGIRPPRMIVSIIGSEITDGVAITDKLRYVLKNGLAEAPDVWVFTNGRNAGASQLVAAIMSEIRSKMSASVSQAADYAVPVIGILPLRDIVQQNPTLPEDGDSRQKRERLCKAGNYVRYMPKDQTDLDPNHTFFVVVADSTIQTVAEANDKEHLPDVEFRRNWMTAIRKLPFESFMKWRRLHLEEGPVNMPYELRQRLKHHTMSMGNKAEMAAFQATKKAQGVQAQVFDDTNQHDHFLEHTTQVATLDLVLGGTHRVRNLRLLQLAIRPETLSPIVVMQGSGGFADLLSYAYRFLHDTAPVSMGLSNRELDALVRKVFQVYTTTRYNERYVEVTNICAVKSKIVNFDLEFSDGTDLDKAFLQALLSTMRSESNDGIMAYRSTKDKHLKRRAEILDVFNRYELHLNMLRYAMGFDRVDEAIVEMEKLDTVWEKLLLLIEEQLTKKRHGSATRIGKPQMGDYQVVYTQFNLLYEAKLSFASSASTSVTHPQDSGTRNHPLLPLPDQYKMALEWALCENNVEQVKALVPKIMESTLTDMADFLYGLNTTRPNEGYGTTLAELYEFENVPEVKHYMEPVLKRIVGDSEIADEFEQKHRQYTQVHNNFAVRRMWTLVMQKLKGDDGLWATTYGGRRYEDLDVKDFSGDGGGLRLIERQSRWNASDMGDWVDDKGLQRMLRRDLGVDRTLESMHTLMDLKSDVERDLMAFQELMIWAVLFDRVELAEYFWQMGGHAIPNALIASTIFAGIASDKAVAKKGKLADVRIRMEQNAHLFERHAIGVLSECYAQDTLLTQDVLEAELVSYDWLGIEFDSLELARLADNIDFITHPACQAVIERKWRGGKSPTERRETYGGNKLSWERLYKYTTAPQIKFWLDVFFYIFLVLMMSAVCIRPLENELSSLEYVLLGWFTALAVEEIRQTFAGDGTIKVTPDEMLEAASSYVADFWNKVDMCSYACFFSAISFRLSDASNNSYQRTAKGLYGFNVLFVYFRFLRAFSVSSSMGPKILIFFKLFYSLVHYIIILLVFIVSYGIFVQAVYNPFLPIEGYSVVMRVFFRPYFQTYGELMLDDIEEESGCFGSTSPFTECAHWVEYTYPWVFAIFLIITSIMIINMLIADFTMTFERIHEESNKVWRMQMFALLQEYTTRTLLPPPINLPVVIFLFFQWLLAILVSEVKFLRQYCFNVAPSLPKGRSMARKEHDIVVEVFQDRLADVYLARVHESVTSDDRLRRIQKRIEDAHQEMFYFKAQTFSRSLRQELRTERGILKSAQWGTEISPISNEKIQVLVSSAHLKDGQRGHAHDKRRKISKLQGLAYQAFAKALHHTFVQTKHMESGLPDDPNPFPFDFDRFARAYRSVYREDFRSSPAARDPSVVADMWNKCISSQLVADDTGIALKPGRNDYIMHIVTRWKRDAQGIRVERMGLPVLEFVAMKHKDSTLFEDYWCIPEMPKAEFEKTRFKADNDTGSVRGRLGSVAGDTELPDTPIGRRTSVELLAFTKENMKYDVTPEQGRAILHEMRAFFSTRSEEEDAASTVDEDPGDTIDVLNPIVYEGFLDSPLNTGCAWTYATVYHFHDDGNLFDAFDLKYPGKINKQQAAEVAWLTVHSNIELQGETESILEFIAQKEGAFW